MKLFKNVCDEATLKRVAETAELHTNGYNYLRGWCEDNTVIDLSDWVYKL